MDVNNKLTLRLADLEADRVNEAAVNGKKLKALFDEVEVCNKRRADLEADRVSEAAVNGKTLKALFDEVEVCNKRRFVAEAELRDRGIRILLPLV